MRLLVESLFTVMTMPVKIMWNSNFSEYFLQGHTEETRHWLNINRRGLEKTIVLDNLTTFFNPEETKIDFAQVTVFRNPFNLSGIGTLALYPLYPLENGIHYAYTPKLRRMKRLSHRVAGSEARFGTDFSPDDSWADGPKTNIEAGGNLWKGVYWPGDAIESTDGEFKLMRKSPCVEVDMKRDHATAVCAAFRDGAYRKILAKSKDNLFTKAGFAKFSK